jgi:hypothetical protein
MQAHVASRKIGIYIDESLLERLNRATVGSLQSRSEIVCRAIEEFLTERDRQDPALADSALRDKVSQLIASGLLQADDLEQEWPRAKNKPWIN